MKIVTCHMCKKVIMEENIGYKDSEGNIYCKTCSIKFLQKKIEDKLNYEKQLRKTSVKKDSKRMKYFILIAFTIVVLEIIFLLLPMSNIIHNKADGMGINDEIIGPLGDLMKMAIVADKYRLKNGKYPNSMDILIRNAGIINDSIHYQTNKKYGYFLYKKGKEVIDPIFTAIGIYPTTILEEEGK